jgi:hypothetical protein
MARLVQAPGQRSSQTNATVSYPQIAGVTWMIKEERMLDNKSTSLYFLTLRNLRNLRIV